MAAKVLFHTFAQICSYRIFNVQFHYKGIFILYSTTGATDIY